MKPQSINQSSKKAFNKSHKDFRKQRKNPIKKQWLEQS